MQTCLYVYLAAFMYMIILWLFYIHYFHLSTEAAPEQELAVILQFFAWGTSL